MARSGELFGARCCDFTLSEDSSAHVAWRLPVSNSEQRQGVVESIVITDMFVVAMVRRFVKKSEPGEFVSRASEPSSASACNRFSSILGYLRVIVGIVCGELAPLKHFWKVKAWVGL